MAQSHANGLQGLATAVARGLGIAHGGANAPGMMHGGGKAPGMAHGGGKGEAIGHGGANAPGIAHGGGKGAARGGGFGFGHASLGNPTLSSRSQNTSHKGETHDGRSFSNHAQDHTDHSKKADQVVQVDDRGPGKEKGFVDSLPPSQEQQTDRGMTLNPATIHSDLDDIVTLGFSPDQELQPDRGLTLTLETIHSDLDDIVTGGLKPGQEVQADPGGALKPETIHSDRDEIAIPGVQPSPEVQDGGGALNPEAIHSDLDETMTLRLQAGQALQTGRGKSLQASWQTIVPDIVPDIDDTPATAVLPEVEKYRPKGLPSTNPELDDDDEKWGLVPYFGILLVFFSWTVQSGLSATKRKAARLKFEPNALRSTGSVNGPRRATLEDRFKPSGTRPPALDKLAAVFSTAGERQQKAPDEKTRASLEHFSGDPDVEKARAKSEHTQEIEEIFHKDFDGIGLG
jgi:hypothetical protein